jgi:nicotinamidase-related amidase
MNLPSQTALLVVDLQRGLFERETEIFKGQELLLNVNKLITRARKRGVPVVYIQHSNKGLLKEDSDGWQLHPDLYPPKNEMQLRKQHGSAFQSTDLASSLNDLKITTVVVCGLTTHGCIKATCIDAHNNGFHVVLASDAHSSFSKDAESLIVKWNEKLSSGIVELKKCAAIFKPEV